MDNLYLFQEKNEKKCEFCNVSLSQGFVFQNDNEIIFTHLSSNSGAHIECYIKDLIREEIKNELNKHKI